LALRHQREYLALAGRQLRERIVTVALREELLHERWVDDRAAVGDALQSVDDVAHLHDPALQQVADPLAALEQVERLVDLDVCREDQDPDLRELGADTSRRVEALQFLRGRHADVDDHQVGDQFADQTHECGRIARLSDHVEARAGQKTGDPFAQEDIVVCDDNSACRHLAPKLTPV
jgi:hypothetical protein